jgi:hypothetical protein
LSRGGKDNRAPLLTWYVRVFDFATLLIGERENEVMAVLLQHRCGARLLLRRAAAGLAALRGYPLFGPARTWSVSSSTRTRDPVAKTTLDTYGHLWPDADQSTRSAIGAVITARMDSVASAADWGGVCAHRHTSAR